MIECLHTGRQDPMEPRVRSKPVEAKPTSTPAPFSMGRYDIPRMINLWAQCTMRSAAICIPFRTKCKTPFRPGPINRSSTDRSPTVLVLSACRDGSDWCDHMNLSPISCPRGFDCMTIQTLALAPPALRKHEGEAGDISSCVCRTPAPAARI